MEQNPPDPSDENASPLLHIAPLRLRMQPNGLMIELTEPDNLVGRHSTADIRLPLPDVSRRHCRFVFTSGCWQVIDLHSLNGVFVNDERVEQQMELQDGDEIRVGSFIFAVELRRVSKRDTLVRRLFPGRPGVPYLNPHRRAS